MVAVKRRIYFDGDRALVSLTKGAVAQVDAQDAGLIAGVNWYLSRKGYAYNHRDAGMMHRLILDAPAGAQVDHINCDKLDNRRANLRLCTNAENRRNGRAYSASGFKGVVRDRTRWRAQIGLTPGKPQIHLGMFATAEEAARAYDAAARKYFSAFARLNFPKEKCK